MTVAYLNGSKATASEVDVDAYFRRIGYGGRREPSLEVLQTLVSRHTQTIAFENLNPWLRWPVYLDRASIEYKIVQSGRGGYCYEQNGLFSYVLRALGFSVRHLGARVLWGRPPGAQTPRSHMLLHVTIDDQPYLVDVGFGGMTPTGVLRFEPEVAQATPHEPYRLLHSGADFLMQAEVQGEWATLYRFDLQEQLPVDYEVSSWYLCNHPQSHFIAGLTVARSAPDARYALRNTELAIHRRNGSEHLSLTSVAALRTALTDTFLLTLPDAPALDLALHRLVEQAA